MRENRTSGTEWGVLGNRHSYHNEHMETNWSHREKLASAIMGGISSVFLAVAFISPIIDVPSKFFIFIGLGLNDFALAISPHVLFERVSVNGFKLRGPLLFGSSAVLAISGNTCFLLSLWYWLIGRTL
jgi:hypothetical protein